MRIEDRNGNLIRIEDGHDKLLILRPDLVIGVTGILAPSVVLRHRLLKFFHENCNDTDLFERLRDKITIELRNLFTSFGAVLSDVHLSHFMAVVLVGVDKQKIRSIGWDSVAPDFPAVEFDDDFLCLGGKKAVEYSESVLWRTNPYLGPSESLLELESVAHEVAKKYPEIVSPSGFSWLLCPTNVEAVSQVCEGEKSS
jgi:hypothetical protein